MAFSLIYRRLMVGRTEREQLKADVVLGMPGAQERYQAEIDDSYDNIEHLAGDR